MYFVFAFGGNGFFTGVYSYDARSTAPSTLVVTTPPEVALAAQFRQQLVQDGTYPKDATARLVHFQPTRVDVYLQNGGTAAVQMELFYSDGTKRTETFFLPSYRQSGISVPLLPYTNFRIEYGKLGECKPGTPNISFCPLEL
jgi:hypothetical protein